MRCRWTENTSYALALAGSALKAKRTDGPPLPEWLRFDKGGKEFRGVTPKAEQSKSGELLVTRVVVKIWDGEKGEVVGGCVADVSARRNEVAGFSRNSHFRLGHSLCYLYI